MRGDWQVGHVPGERMIADIGTKALASTRMLGMKKTGHVEVEDAGKNEERGEEDPFTSTGTGSCHFGFAADHLSRHFADVKGHGGRRGRIFSRIQSADDDLYHFGCDGHPGSSRFCGR